MIPPKKQIFIVAIAAVLIAAGFLSVFIMIDRENIPGAGSSAHSGEARIVRGDESRKLRSHLRMLLVLGTDDYSINRVSDDSVFNGMQSDFLAVLVFDNFNKTVQPVQINRDTMCDVPMLGINGLLSGYINEQITLAYNYGSGREDSCRNSSRAVSRLLFGLPIDYYMAFTMDAVPALTDLVGGVTVTLEDDLPDIDSSFTAGSTVTLTGDKALRFVRTRDHTFVDANAVRMGRHRQFLYGFEEAAKKANSSDSEISLEAYNSLSEYITTDLTFNSYADVINWLSEYELLPIITTEGSYVLGEQYAEFYVDEEALWNTLVNAFC